MYLVTGLLGIVLVFAPYISGYETDAAALSTSLIVGAVLIISSIFEWTAKDKEAWEYWLTGIFGFAAMAIPFLLNFSLSAIWVMVTIGIVTVLAAGTKLFPSSPR